MENEKKQEWEVEVETGLYRGLYGLQAEWRIAWKKQENQMRATMLLGIYRNYVGLMESTPHNKGESTYKKLKLKRKLGVHVYICIYLSYCQYFLPNLMDMGSF